MTLSAPLEQAAVALPNEEGIRKVAVIGSGLMGAGIAAHVPMRAATSC